MKARSANAWSFRSGGGKHGADLVGQRDGNDPLFEGDARSRHGLEHEPAEHVSSAQDGQLDAAGGKLEALAAELVVAQRQDARALPPAAVAD